MIIRQKVTGFAAQKYVRKQLSRGGHLSDRLRNISLADGEIYAFVPGGTPDKEVNNFECGLLYPSMYDSQEGNPYVIPIQNEARMPLTELILDYLNLAEINCCLFEDPILSPKDKSLASSNMDYVYLPGGQVFYFFNRRNSDVARIYKALVESENYIFLCALSSLELAAQSNFKNKEEFDPGLLDQFSTGVSSFFVMAYDHEGFLMWTRNF